MMVCGNVQDIVTVVIGVSVATVAAVIATAVVVIGLCWAYQAIRDLRK